MHIFFDLKEKITKNMKKILVADDEETVRMVLKQILEQGGFQVETAKNGVEALSKLKADNFNMLISDINMPEMDGVELLSKAKQALPELPVIFITAFGKSQVIMQAMKSGLSSYIEKPFRMNDVIGVVNQYT
jgi:DNA-binding NtrC family response regulator